MKPKTYNCPVEAAVDVFGGKWKALILWWLQQRTWRFAELRRQLPGITEKMLTQQLRELEEDGIVCDRATQGGVFTHGIWTVSQACVARNLRLGAGPHGADRRR